MLLASQLPLHIVLVHNAFALMPPGTFAPYPGTLHIRYLPIIETDSWKKEQLVDHIDATRTIMHQSLQEMKAKFRV